MLFKLVVNVWWAVCPCHEERDRSEIIKKKIFSFTKEKAIEKARSFVEKIHEKRSHFEDYGLHADLYDAKNIIWETNFREEQLARKEIPAIPARLAVPAHFEEETF